MYYFSKLAARLVCGRRTPVRAVWPAGKRVVLFFFFDTMGIIPGLAAISLMCFSFQKREMLSRNASA